MMNNTRVQELMASMNSFRKGAYHKSEILNEMLALQNEIVNLTFNGVHATTAELRIYDVERHLEELNVECGHVADEALRKFIEGSKVLCNLIKAEISGNKGEFKAFRSLEYLKSQNVVLKNVELEDGDLRTELDAVVITPKCITIVEVKNTNRNIFIDERGNYYRIGEFLKKDCDIAGKMAVKENLLRKALADAGITDVKIQGIVVFTDNRIEVQNKYSDLRTCFVSQLNYMIDGIKGEEIFSNDDMEKIKEVVEAAECKEYYTAGFDAEQYKLDFATVMATLEAASEIKAEVDEEEIKAEAVAPKNEAIEHRNKVPETKKASFKDVMRTIISSKYTRYAGSAVAGFALAIISGVAVINTINR